MQYKVNYNDLAHGYCREFLDGESDCIVDQYGKHNGTDYIVIFDNEQSAEKPYYRRTKLKAMSRDELIELWENQFDEYRYFDDMTKAELIDDLLTVTRRQYFAKHYEQNNRRDIEEYDFCATGYCQGDLVKVCNADDIQYITSDYIKNIFFDVPIHAKAEVWQREDSDSAWELVDEFYLCEYTDIYEPCYERVYQGLMNEKNPLAHLVAYDMPSGIFENIE